MNDQIPMPLRFMFEDMLRVLDLQQDLPDPETNVGRVTRTYLAQNWRDADEGLLSRTTRLRVFPRGLPAPFVFDFELDAPYKRRLGPNAPVELASGPIRGTIYYRPDLFVRPQGRVISVALDRQLGYYHPNYSPLHNQVCIGDLPPGPFPLRDLLEAQLVPILTYQNRTPGHTADPSASQFFAYDPTAMEGLEPVEPLY